MLYKYKNIIYTIVLILFLTILFIFALFLFPGKDENYDFQRQSIKINRIYSKIDGKIFASVPSNGDYLLKDANENSFRTFENSIKDNQIGFDDKNVYAGNMILEDLKPQNLRALGNNYYTDGKTTYYCSSISDNNPKMSVVGFFISYTGYNLGISQKPKTYWYPHIKLPSNITYQSYANYEIAISSEKAYFKGLEMPKAIPLQLKPILLKENNGRNRESLQYFTDGKHVYFEEKLLDLPYNPHLYQLDIAGDLSSRQAYLIDPLHGNVIVNDEQFKASDAPYNLLGRTFNHSSHVIFKGKNGIYYYDYDDKKIKKASKNIFGEKKINLLSDEVFEIDNKVYFLNSKEVWKNKRGLISRNTEFLLLEDVPANQLSYFSKLKNNSGSIWRSGNRYFYFETYGSLSRSNSAIYEIKNLAIANKLIQLDVFRNDDFLNLINNKELIEPKSKEIFSAISKYHNDNFEILIYIILFGVIVYGILKLSLKDKDLPPFEIIGNTLIINNLFFKKYQIETVKNIHFSIKTNFRNGYSGLMRIETVDGKKSKNYMFIPRFTIGYVSRVVIINHIYDLQKTLSEHGINSHFED